MSGVTRPNTVSCATAHRRSSSLSSVDASTYRSALGMPTCLAMAEAVAGSSPDITRTPTPCFPKYEMVGAAVGLIWSRMATKPSVWGSPTMCPSSSKPSHVATTSTRMSLSKGSPCASRDARSVPRTNWVAPITYARPSSVTQPEYLYLDEKGMTREHASALRSWASA